MKTKFLSLMSSAALFSVVGLTGIAHADPIYLQPGQCIVVGSQQVCAIKPDSVDTAPTSLAQTLYVCRYGNFRDSEVPDLKSYSLVQIVTSSTGVKSETHLKNFGQNGKDSCEKEAEAKSKK